MTRHHDDDETQGAVGFLKLFRHDLVGGRVLLRLVAQGVDPVLVADALLVSMPARWRRWIGEEAQRIRRSQRP